MIRVLALIPALVCCTRLEQYRCETDAQCSQGGVAGACEDTGFCSADDSDCPSGRRYVDEAEDDLAGTCVTDNAMYLSPDGDDAAEGTRNAPWRTFSRGLAALRAGDTLILHDGTYGNDEGTGFADIDCRGAATACEGAPCRHGTAEQPITVRALHERQAFVRSSGVGDVIKIRDCRGWALEGIRAERGDFEVEVGLESGSPLAIDGASDVVLRRLLIAKPTRYLYAGAMQIRGSARVLVEECEVLDFHRWGIVISESSDVVIRRSYLNPRGYADLEGSGWYTECPETGDVGVSANYTGTIIVENTISEGACTGFQIDAGWLRSGDTGIGDDGVYAGSIAKDARFAGFSIRTDCNEGEACTPPDQWAAGNDFVDDVAIDCGDGFWFRGGQDNAIERCTAVNSNNAGVRFDELPDTVPLAFPSSAHVFNTLVAGAENGFVVQDQAVWSIHYSVADVSGVAYSPDDANVMDRQDLDPQLGDCKVTLPATSPLRGAGRDGVNIGATIENRYENGVLTDTPLWLEGGAFPCGAVVPGVNDEPRASCSDVHERLNVGPGGCPQR